MASEPLPLDIDDKPELLRLAEEVNATGEGRPLRRGNRIVAVLMPVTEAKRKAKTGRKRGPARKRITEADIEAFRAAAGSWKGVDVDRFMADIYASRQSSRPPVDL
jgi:hypothetical protein